VTAVAGLLCGEGFADAKRSPETADLSLHVGLILFRLLTKGD
jgi:hypothetical protein